MHVLHLAFYSLLCDWLPSEGIPGVRHHPDAPTSDRENGPEEACPGEEPNRDEKRVNGKIDRKVGPETRLRLKPPLIRSTLTCSRSTGRCPYMMCPYGPAQADDARHDEYEVDFTL